MNPLKTKGQTALEYLLILVVAIVVVVAVMIYMQSSSTSASNKATWNDNLIQCQATSCNNLDDCGAAAAVCTGLTGDPCVVGAATSIGAAPTNPCTVADNDVNFGSQYSLVKCLGYKTVGGQPILGNCRLS